MKKTNQTMDKFLWISAGTLLGFYLGYRHFHIPTKKFTNQVIFFPYKSKSIQKNPKNISLEQLVKYLISAEKSIDLCLYMVTSHNLGQAIFDRMDFSNVKVRLIVDEAYAHVSGSLVSELRKRGAFVKTKKSDYLMHHKFAIIDDDLVLSGSFNWTMQAASGNEENVIVSSEPDIVDPFCNHFKQMWLELE